MTTGSDRIWTTLEALGVECVFGLPGTQNVDLFEGLRRSRLRTVLATSELGAAFMANGYARSSGRVGVLCTIPGPGFTLALTGLAEARHDSAAVLHITVRAEQDGPRKFRLQAMDLAAVAAPLVKATVTIREGSELADRLMSAYRLALSGEPGPVLVEVAADLLASFVAEGLIAVRPAVEEDLDAVTCDRIRVRLESAGRPVFFVGQGCAGGAEALRRVAEQYGAPVATTLSGRGVLPEDHPLCMAADLGGEGVGPLNDLLAEADLIVALGCKLAHNGTGGFRLRLPEDRLVHVDASNEVLGANYPASLSLRADVPTLLARLADQVAGRPARSGWPAGRLQVCREGIAAASARCPPEPAIYGVGPATPAGFFRALRNALPRDGILALDSGLHQVLARRHFPVLSPRGLLAPSDFQSMGFGLPAAIGAKLACPGRPVVALIGDGGLALSGLEMLTAVRERLALTVIVFNDGHLGLIRQQQVQDYGVPHAVGLQNPDFGELAHAIGMAYRPLTGDARATLRRAIESGEPTLVEVRVGDSWSQHWAEAKSLGRASLRRAIPVPFLEWVRRLGKRSLQ